MDETGLRQAQRVERILDAATDLFAHYGFDKTTMDDIARAASVSKGALYLHFRGKDDLFDALMLRENDILQEDVMRRLEAEGDRLSVFSVYRHSIEAALARPMMRALLTDDHRVMGAYMHRIRNTPQYASAMEFRVEMVQQLQLAGLIRADVNADTVSAVLIVVKFGYLNLPDLADNLPPPEETGRLIAEMLQRAFGTEYGDSAAGRAAMQKLFEQGRAFLQAMRAQRAASPRTPA